MEPITATDPLSHSAELTAENVARLRELFPQAVTEDGAGKRIDFDVLRELLGGELATGEEKYGLNWHGKRAARRLALTPSTGTLRPAPEDSVDWDTTQNLVIEGDNLEVLKLLQKSYAGKVNMIYIDPPYNTGNDFVYKDDFMDSIGNYQRITGQRDAEGAKLTTNAESSGRFHTDWLNMLFPRLILARSLLGEHGILFVSIDHGEIANLKNCLDVTFGESSFLGILTWITTTQPDNIGRARFSLQTDIEYVLVYSRCNKSELPPFRLRSQGLPKTYPHRGSLGACRFEIIERAAEGAYMRPTLANFRILGQLPRQGKQWQIGEITARRLEQSQRVEIVDGIVKRAVYPEDEIDEQSFTPFWSHLESVATSQKGKAELLEDTGEPHGFDTVKPRSLIEEMLAHLPTDALILDFFAGSGTTARAAFSANIADGGSRRSISVQLPVPMLEDNPLHATTRTFLAKAGRSFFLSELTKERLRRAGKKLNAENPLFHGDLGFRVFKLDTTSIRPWDPTLPVTEQRLLGEVDNILPGRTEQDLLYELLLKRGLELTVPIVERTLAGKQVFAVSTGDLIACLAPRIENADVEALAEGIVAWHKELAPAPAVDPGAPLEKSAKVDPPLIVFRDTAFADDVAKSNLTEILKQQGLTDVRSL